VPSVAQFTLDTVIYFHPMTGAEALPGAHPRCQPQPSIIVSPIARRVDDLVPPP